jgi:hypothetical protein
MNYIKIAANQHIYFHETWKDKAGLDNHNNLSKLVFWGRKVLWNAEPIVYSTVGKSSLNTLWYNFIHTSLIHNSVLACKARSHLN